MSHLPERKEKICLNCKSVIYGRYCHVCGQENTEPKESFWHLVTHFVYDITHFDGKFFSSLKYLLFRPGYMSHEYLRGRRASYLNPIRMYVFTSAIFFLIFFSFIKPGTGGNTTVNGKTLDEISRMDSVTFAKFTTNINKEDHRAEVPMTRDQFKSYIDSTLSGSGVRFVPGQYKTRREYDSLLKAGVKKHNWVERQLVYKNIEVNEKYHNNAKAITTAFLEAFLHSLPQMLFISLPLLALILKLLYIRRKQFYYVNHLIFGIHFYIFLFIDMLLIFLSVKLYKVFDLQVFKIAIWFLVVSLFIYEYKGLRNFYQQGRGKTIAKFIVLNFLFVFVLSILFAMFLLFSLFKI
jgi:hypothetical protein